MRVGTSTNDLGVERIVGEGRRTTPAKALGKRAPRRLRILHFGAGHLDGVGAQITDGGAVVRGEVLDRGIEVGKVIGRRRQAQQRDGCRSDQNTERHWSHRDLRPVRPA